MKIKLLIVSVLLFTNTAISQERSSHLIGVKGAYNVSNVSFNPVIEGVKAIKTYKNYSLSYINYNSLWKTMPYFGFQAEVYFQEQGYELNGNKVTMESVLFPLTSKFHIDFWRMRVLMNAGGFVGYRKSKSDGFAETDYKFDAGFIGGGGLAFVLKPFELHLEANYQYSLTYLYNPQKDSQINVSFSHPSQLLFSVAIYYQLFGK